MPLIRRIRAHSDLPIIVLSARSETTDKIMGLGLGADDYIAKPFDGLEVIARVEACLRRLSRTKVSPSPAPSLLTVRDLTLDTSACVLIKDGTSIELTSIEYRILKLFMESPGRVFTKNRSMKPPGEMTMSLTITISWSISVRFAKNWGNAAALPIYGPYEGWATSCFPEHTAPFSRGFQTKNISSDTEGYHYEQILFPKRKH